jgi:hypothetical protein
VPLGMMRLSRGPRSALAASLPAGSLLGAGGRLPAWFCRGGGGPPPMAGRRRPAACLRCLLSLAVGGARAIDRCGPGARRVGCRFVSPSRYRRFLCILGAAVSRMHLQGL